MLFVGLACNMLRRRPSTPDPFATLNVLYTAAAQTQQASGTTAATATPAGTATNPFPTFAVVTPNHTAAPVILCNAAAFVEDVSIADGTIIGAGDGFTKTWRVRNVGSCAWSTSYSLVFVSGDRLDAPSSVRMPGSVAPGQYIDLSVDMNAPDSNGSYQGYWKLRDPSGNIFGNGSQAQTPFWVDIKVAGPTYVLYNFANNFCDADWQNNNRDLPCPGSDGDSKGYVLRLTDPVLENGVTEDQPGLLTVPKDAFNGVITGTYPPIKIRSGDRFRSLINCQYRAYSCNVTFRLQYQIDGGNVKTLGSWNEGLRRPVLLDRYGLGRACREQGQVHPDGNHQRLIRPGSTPYGLLPVSAASAIRPPQLTYPPVRRHAQPYHRPAPLRLRPR